MSEVIRALEAAGWVRQTGMTSGRVGRAAVLYEIDGRAGCLAGIDLGATWLRLSLTDVLGAELASREIRTEALGGDLPAGIAKALSQLMPDSAGPLRHACLSVPGVIDPGTGRLTMAPQLPALMGVDLSATMQAALGCSVVVENDVNAAMLGEYWRGEAEATSAAYISLGTGVGMGAIIGGQLLRGASGAAGEVAYLPIGGDPQAGESRKLGAGLDDLAQAARVGDAAATEVIAHAGKLGGALLVSVQAMLDPALVVIGGKVGSLPQVFEAIRAEVATIAPRPMQLIPGALGARASVVGAAAQAREAMFEALFGAAVGVGNSISSPT
ncbi:MAG: ROK family protein [Maritimibacter sp.]